ncbi:envelope stress response membrane protein PspB [Megalodesulfovibrio paquesii]
MGLVMGFWLVLVPALVIAAGIWLFIRLFGNGKRQGGDDEARIIQECYERLSQMERRVESLETLLLDAAESRRRREDRD